MRRHGGGALPWTAEMWLPWYCPAEQVRCTHWPAGNLRSGLPFYCQTACPSVGRPTPSTPSDWLSRGARGRPCGSVLWFLPSSSDWYRNRTAWTHLDSNFTSMLNDYQGWVSLCFEVCTNTHSDMHTPTSEYFYLNEDFHRNNALPSP